MSNRIQITNNLGVTDYAERKRNATARDAKNFFDDMPWKELSAMRITNPENIMLEICGSETDGFSISYEIVNRSYITSTEPSAADCRKLIGLFAMGDPQWKNQVAWIPFEGDHSDGTVNASGGCLGMLLAGLVLAGLFFSQNSFAGDVLVAPETNVKNEPNHTFRHTRFMHFAD